MAPKLTSSIARGSAKSVRIAKKASGLPGVLGLDVQVPALVDDAVQQGLPYSAFEAMEGSLGITAVQLSQHIRIPSRTLSRRKHDKVLTPEESDRLARIGSVFAKVLDLFDGDEVASRRWMSAPARALGGKTPLQLSETHLGTKNVEALIEQIEDGVLP